MKFTRVSGLLLVVLALVLAACGDTPTEPASTKSATTAASTTTAAPTPTTAVATTTIAPVPTATKIPTTTVAATTAASVNSKAIRSTDWLAVFKADPTLTLSKGPNDSTYIESKTDKWGGVAILDRIEYADLDVDTAGTGPEEAVISLDSTGTAGVINFLVYRYATPFPKLVARQDGYKLYVKPVTANSKGIDVQRALYGPNNPNCCPAALGIDHYVLQNDKLTVATSSVQYIPESTKQFVDDYYTLLNDRKFEQAYALHSKDFQIKNPYKQWAAGYANTKSIKAEIFSDPNSANVAHVVLTAVENSSGGPKTTGYNGNWTLIWDEQAQDLRMNEGRFGEIIASTTVILQPGTNVKPKINDMFQPLISNLLQQTGTPIFLPSYISYGGEGTQLKATLTKVNTDSYHIDIVDIGNNCTNANKSCPVAYVEGGRNASSQSLLKGKSVKLNNDLVGIYTESSCGANCTSAAITWQQYESFFTISVNFIAEGSLVSMVNTAIDAGPYPR